MKTLYLFHDSWTQYIKADLAASQFPFDGFVVIERTRPWWGEYLWKRARRIGFLKTLDEVFLRLHYLIFQAATDRRALKKYLGEVQRNLPANYKRPPIYRVHDINSDTARDLLHKLAPDVCVLMVNVILKEKIFSIPPHGMLVFHPGVTPEYRGPHSAFWAVLNGEQWGIGWSLLRVNAGIDTGNVLAQASTERVDPRTQSHVLMQHISHIDGTAKVLDTLRALERGETPDVPTNGRTSHNYTHPGISDYFKYRRKVKELRSAAAARGPADVRSWEPSSYRRS